ncbi:MAG: hypothetical protein GY791_09355 [Alphaproteobacteria bacterium]|nr:hypothetical protein [Alphaproteobacteria bacterium]
MGITRSTALALLGTGALLALSSQDAGAAGAKPQFFAGPAVKQATTALRLAAYSYDVYQIQRGLNELGYDAGPSDGLMGARTGNAIRAYQRDNGLLVTGSPSPSLVAHIQDTQRQRAAAQQQQQQQQAAPQPTPQPAPQPEVTSAERQVVLDIQAGLRRLGYSVPVVSGDMDDSTREAIRAYQRDNNLLVDGRASPEIAAHIQQKSSQTASLTSRETVMDVQKALAARGYNPGPADGAMGTATRNAIRTYQVDAGMTVDGRISQDLLERLGIATAATTTAAPTTAEPTTAEPSAEPGTATTVEIEPETATPEAPAYRFALQDAFADGNYTSGPRWTVQAGKFDVTPAGALTSTVTVQAPSTEKAGEQLVKGLLGQALGVNLQAPQDVAAISSGAQVGNQFRIRMTLSGSGQPGVFSVGPFAGNNVGLGYRLESNASQPRTLRLIAATQNGASVIASANPITALQDGNMHEILWERDAEGLMKVAIDGALVLETRDNSQQGGFDGISLINNGGTWSVGEIAVETVP